MLFAKHFRCPLLNISTAIYVCFFFFNKLLWQFMLGDTGNRRLHFSKLSGSTLGARGGDYNANRSQVRKIKCTTYCFLKTSAGERRKLDFSKCQDLTAEACVGWSEMRSCKEKQNMHNGRSGDDSE